ncbi:hypothetical protein PENSPDRAFT_757741 [Peniophora sp. CONT]|nr:hypothetical protein PENSPDRAFT_757741 [Peniophora sp. CONT]
MHILSVPPELTVEFFHHVLLLDPPSVSLHGKSLGWINVTFVCQYWRMQAIGCPGLWTDVPGALGSSWINTFLERSRESSLVLKNFDEDGILHKLDDVLPKILHRIRVLAIQAPVESTIGTLLTSRPAPQLQKCFLVGVTFPTSTRGGGKQGTSKDDTTELFAANAPRLNALALLNPVSFPWTSVVLSGLVHLRLHVLGIEVTEITSVIHALRNMQHLENLALHCLHYQEVVTNTQTIELNRLKIFEIDGDHTFFHSVYRHILHPRSTRLIAACVLRDPLQASTDIDGILTLLSSHPTRRPFEAYKTLAVSPDSNQSLLTEAWEEELLFTDTKPPAPPFEFTFRVQFPEVLIQSILGLLPEAIYEIVSGITRTLTFRNTRVLCLNSRCTVDVLIDALMNLPNSVSTLSFTYCPEDDPSNMANVLVHLSNATARGENDRRDPILPKLQTLSFAQERYGLMTSAMGNYPPPMRLLDILQGFVVRRQRCGAPLRTIYVHPSTLRTDPTSVSVHIPPELQHLITENALRDDHA